MAISWTFGPNGVYTATWGVTAVSSGTPGTPQGTSPAANTQAAPVLTVTLTAGGGAVASFTGDLAQQAIAQGAVNGLTAQLPWLPSDNGLLAATYDISSLNSNTGALTAGVMYLAKVQIRSAITATNIWWLGNTGGTGASTGSFTGLYSSAGVLLSGSADVATQFQATGAQSAALTTPQALAAGTFAWIAMLSNLASTQPVFRSGPAPSAAILNLNLSAANFRSGIFGTSQTALPASFTPSAQTGNGVATFWAGIN